MLPWRRRRPTLLPLDQALSALGDDGVAGRWAGTVPLASIAGSEARADDFDADFRLVNPALRPRWEGVAARLLAGEQPDAVDLIQLGDLYFVRDGHHRISAARSLGWECLPARVTRICTIAFAMCCLRAAHLASKAAERRFLERIPLPDQVRRDLWLERPEDWMRLADQAEAWAYRAGYGGQLAPEDLAAAWWLEEVTPVLDRIRHELDRDPDTVGARDVELYVAALRARDRLGSPEWPDRPGDLVAAG